MKRKKKCNYCEGKGKVVHFGQKVSCPWCTLTPNREHRVHNDEGVTIFKMKGGELVCVGTESTVRAKSRSQGAEEKQNSSGRTARTTSTGARTVPSKSTSRQGRTRRKISKKASRS